MKRFAYLLSNNDGLPGVKKDVSDFRYFLLSCQCGAWNPEEIVERPNCKLSDVEQDLKAIKAGNFDYVVFYYSGHGSYERNTRLYLNGGDDNMGEDDVLGLSPKQLSIFDSCRFRPANESEKQASVCDEALNSSELIRKFCREKFDRMVRDASSKQIALYACRIGEYATATANGSTYTQSLLSKARSMCAANDADAVSVHDACSSIVAYVARVHGVNQHPDVAVVPANCAAGALPFAIKKPQLLLG